MTEATADGADRVESTADPDRPASREPKPSEPKPPEPKRRPLRLLRRLVLLGLGLWALYIVAINVFLNTSLAPKVINRKPEKWQMGFAGGWSIIPGRVHLSDVNFDLRARRQDYRFTVQRIFANIAVLKLPGRRLVTQQLDLSGLDVAITLRPASAPQPPPPTRRTPGWRIELRGVRVDDIERFALQDIGLSGGSGRLTTDFRLQVRGEMEVDNARLEWTDMVLSKAGEVVAEPVRIDFEGGLSALNPKLVRGTAVLDYLNGQLEFSGDVERLSIFSRFFSNVKWIQTLDGSGSLDTNLAIADGRIIAGSELDVTAEDLRLDVLGYAAEGSGRVIGTVTEPPAASAEGSSEESTDADSSSTAATSSDASTDPVGPDDRLARMEVVFDDFAVRRKPAVDPYVHGTGLRLIATSRDPNLRDGMSDLDFVLDMPEAEVPNMAVYGSYLPPHLDFSIDSGVGALRLHLEGSAIRQHAQGELVLTADQVKGRFRDLEFEGALETDTKITGSDLDSFNLGIVGTRLAVKEVTLNDGRNTAETGWWMTLDVPDGTLEMGEPSRVQAEVDILMKDTRAIMALFGEVKPWIDRFERILTVKEVRAEASVAMEPQTLSLRHLSLEARRLRGRAELELGEERPRRGILYVRLNGFAVGLEIQDKGRDGQRIRPKR
ncbi:MAG: hypothetical protein AAF560_00530, partial [Acidobacteriota bacterium]